MNSGATRIIGLFESDDRAAEAVAELRRESRRVADVHGPIPSTALRRALGMKKSMVGWFTLAGGVIGFFLGYFLAVFASARWGLVVSGKPVIAYIPFFIVGFEFTILFSVLGNVIGLILLARLPAYGDLPHPAPRCSADRFGVVVDCPAVEAPAVKRLFTRMGAELPEAPHGKKEARDGEEGQ